MTELLHSPAVLALELADDARLTRTCLSRDEAAQLADHIAADIERLFAVSVKGSRTTDALAADVRGADLIVAGALYDQAQLLRPGWPLYAELAELAQRQAALPGAAAEGARQLIAFGSHEDTMPTPTLQPEPALGTGTMLLLPWMFSAPAALAQVLGERMERDFVAQGEAGSRTADFLMRTLGIRLQHARYLTRHDVCALSCVQLEHAGFSALWQMLECALLAPDSEGVALSSRGRRWRYAHGGAHTALPVYADWVAEQGQSIAPEERLHAYAGWLFELRQYAALLNAHRLPLRFDDATQAGSWPVQLLAEADPGLPPAQLLAHEARGLGIVLVTVAQAVSHDQWRVLARAWPLDPATHEASLQQLAQRFGVVEPLQRLGLLSLEVASSEQVLARVVPSLH